MACLHSAGWWQRHWERGRVAEVELADTLPDGWKLWWQWQQAIAPENQVEIDALSADQGRHLGYVRAVAVRSAETDPDAPISSIPVEYSKWPLWRNS